ncbi:imidazole glycerol phosphate synthase subunit HisH [Granulibacter bethesdensis]|uniref:imidazole glycerol phosphate synthase subunit HisH n=1 Tax=Granulibacter bethesdensis TaxID=364410 RepID=UPI0003F1CAFB|nr:imidazole glycerol phosphate synthase subunit HisH [Granulibacter bethesdensis]AHJ67899.1 Imidazole glycerol phosphate synthase, glutamine amidotransferase subunit [Granulibacter bethesdensis]
MKVVVIDSGTGNLASARRGLEIAAGRAGLDAKVIASADPLDVRTADRIVLPGQGAFADCARGIAAIEGMRGAIEEGVAAGKPFLGICVGMQLMAERGLEHEGAPGFGWIKGEIAPIRCPGLRLPQMGWNGLDFTSTGCVHPLLNGLQADDHAYFVHGYALRDGDQAQILATTEYGGPVVAMVASGNRAGTQFHVEKSQEVGLRILQNFMVWTPEGISGS